LVLYFFTVSKSSLPAPGFVPAQAERKPSANAIVKIWAAKELGFCQYSSSQYPLKYHHLVVYSFGSPVLLNELYFRSNFILKTFIRYFNPMKIFGLEDFAISDTDLANQYADKRFGISISFSYYPNVESLKPLTPKQRRLVVCGYLRDQFKVVKDNYPTSDYQIKGTRFKPWGITGQLTGQQLAELQSNDKIKSIWVEQVEGLEKIEKEIRAEPESCPLPFYMSVTGLFVAEFDGLDATTGVQLTEERIVLVKALDWDEAKKKARAEFDKYS